MGWEIRGGEMKGALCPFLLSGSFHPGAIPSCCVLGCLDVACGGGVGWGIVLAALVLWKFPRLFFSTLRAVSEARRVLLRKKEHLQCSLGLAGLESHPELCFRAWPECGRTPPYQNLSPIQVPRLPAEGVTWSASLWWNFAPTQTPNLCLSGSNI